MRGKRVLLFVGLVLLVGLLAVPATLALRSGGADRTAVASKPTASASQVRRAVAGWRPGAPDFFSTKGNKIVDSQGNEVRLTGVNWFGMETGTFAPHGLWERNWEDMLDQMVELGYNTLRLPYSNQMFDGRSLAQGIDFERNPDLRGLRPIEIMDKIIEGAGKRGMRVILDRHRPDAEKQRELWYTAEYPEERWIADWRLLAARYKGNDTVIGADLHNEPHGPATWGSGDPKTDWRLAAERAGNAIHEVNPDWLILVEGIEQYAGEWFWWGANLRGVAEHPVRLKVPNKLVYSPHEYGPGVWSQSWFKDPAYPSNLPQVWHKYWGFIHEQNLAPILVGEFGGRRVDSESPEGQWQRTLLAFMKEKGIHFTYWAFNANSGDTGGIIDEEDREWRAVVKEKVDFLAQYQWPLLRSGTATTVNKAAAPTYGDATTKRAVMDGDLRVLYRPGEAWNNEGSDGKAPSLVPEIRLVNLGVAPVALDELEVRYWFKDEGTPPQARVEFASVGAGNVRAEVAANAGDQNYVLKLTFAAGAGTILGKGGNVDVQPRIFADAGRTYRQADDYSFDGSRDEETITNFTNWERIALYQGGRLVWGAEPQG